MEKKVAKTLETLLKLQTIDSKLDELNKVKGDLPNEVQDLDDEIIGYETRVNKFDEKIAEFEEEIEKRKEAKKNAEKLIVKYEDQQMNVRNNREYDAISKEIETEKLEIVLSEKKIKEASEQIDLVKEEINKTKEVLDQKKEDLEIKKNELGQITKECESEEAKLMEEREKQFELLEPRLVTSYVKIRENAFNGLAVVKVKRGACGGCFNIVPPQRQVDIKEKKKLIVCEHCGRIFADVEDLVVEEQPKKKRTRKSAKSEETA